MESQLSAFGNALIYIIVGLVFVCGGLFTWYMVRPHRPNSEKNTPYECGEDAIGTPWGNFNIRFYIIALIFILFDVEVVFLFPWATAFGNEELIIMTDGYWGWFSLFEVFIFIGVLALGLAYVWAKGYLDWDKPAITPTNFKGAVPNSLYKEFNSKK